MKRLYLIILLAALTFSGMAQTVGEAFYIYRNDGQFNAFNRGEVQSIEFSYEDADGNQYNEIVTQIVNTADSVYKIPLAAIDSIGFVQPETIVANDVFPLTAEHAPYITNGDVLSFSMSTSTPAALQPKVGNIVVATADCSAFPNGIIARVESINQLGNVYQYSCSQAYYDEVFDQLVVYQPVLEGSGVDNAARTFDLNRASLTATLWNVNWAKTIEAGGTTTTLNIGDRATATVTVRKTLTTPLFFQLALVNAMTSSIGFNAQSTASISKELQIGKTITAGKIAIPYTMGLLWLQPKLSLFGYFEEQGKVELNYSGHFNRTDNLTFTYLEHKWSFSHRPVTEAGTDVASLSMEGSAEVGLKPQIDFSLNGQQAGFGLSARAGLKEYINFVFDATRLADGGLYDAMRDSYCRTTIPWSVTVHANANIFSRYDASQSDGGPATYSHTFAPANEPRWGDDRYIFPLFEDVKGKRQDSDRTKADASAKVSRTPLLPVQVGFSLLDKDNNILQTQYDSRSYEAGSLFGNYSCVLSNLKDNEKYKVRPSVKLFGYDVLASPSAEIDSDETTCPDANHPHAIDLGLPSGTKWACCNVGASAPEGYGNYYAWGETSPKSVYNWETYQYYNNGYVNIGSDIAGTSYDAATANWGAPWRMPSLTQIQELLNNTTSTWTTENGVYGRKFVGPNGGTIFFPAAGGRWDSDLFDAGTYGNYWSSTLHESGPYYACGLYFRSGYVRWSFGSRLDGRSVRPVR